MAHGALHRVLAHEPISFRTYYALNVVGQKIFEIHTKHRFSLPAAFFFSSSFSPNFVLMPASIVKEPIVLCLTHRNHFHPTQNLRQLDTPAIDSRLHRTLRDLQKINDLLVTKFFDISQYHTRS